MSTVSPPHASRSRRRIVVAMSGGVDSSVVAGLLHREGHEVIGITLQLYDHGEAVGRKGACCAGQDIADARRVAETLGIPHYVLDYESRFAAEVIDAFAASYIAGETPIPCVTCNQKIKFRDLLDTANELGAEALATGHYVRRAETADGPALFRARDEDRDQSYFLFATTRAQLERVLFPLGDIGKTEVRALAREFGLAIADKSDSQDICFVPRGRYGDVIERLKPGAMRPGDIVHADGRRLGRHEGTINYTIGQRRGLGVATGEPLFVIGINPATNEVVVGPRDLLRTRRLVLRNVNWLGDGAIKDLAGSEIEIFARVRSSQAPRPAALRLSTDGSATVELRHGDDGIAAGQACVFYTTGAADARVLGGGFIARTVRSADGEGVRSAHAVDGALT